MNFRLLLLAILLPGIASAQFLPFNTTLQQANIQAIQNDKLIFVLIESVGCQQCNDVADKGLKDESVQRQLSAHFVALRISPFHPDLNYIKEKYNYISEGNNVLFLDKWGTLVHRLDMSTSNPRKYLQEITTAIERKAEADKVRTLEQAALAGNMETDKLYELMQTRKQLSLPTDALLNQYVNQLPADSLQSVTTLQRIYSMSPILGSKADQVLRKNPDLCRQAWNLLQREQYVVRQQIIFKSRQQAIQEKQVAKAIQVADFARSKPMSKAEAEQVYQYNMLEYY